MKDLKSLYFTAKNSKRSSDISAYSEAVMDCLNNNPNNYLSNLEYIISSSRGLKTWNEFVDKYGISIGAFDTIYECFSKCKSKASVIGKNVDVYTESLNRLDEFRNKYSNCFEMYNYYNNERNDKYVNAYYSFNENGIQNSKLIVGMVNMFGESAIADAIITADKIGGNALKQVTDYIERGFREVERKIDRPRGKDEKEDGFKKIKPQEGTTFKDSQDFWDKFFKDEENKNESTSFNMLSQWANEAYKDIGINNTSILESRVNDLRNRKNQAYRESVIMGYDKPILEYTEDEVIDIQSMIEFKEYQVTLLEANEAIDLQKEIYELYECIDGFVNEDGSYISEGQWMVNTRNKKTGEAPAYLANNHDIGWGEDDSPKKKSTDDDDDLTIDDFKRPSADSSKTDEDIEDDFKSADDNDEVSAKPTSGGNNYYYYTYNNSMNKNTNSFNRDNHSDYSTDNSVDNSRRDNHSDNRVDNSRHYNNSYKRDMNESTEEDEDDDGDPDAYTEGVGTVMLGVFSALVGVSYIWYKVRSFMDSKKFKNEIRKIISDITGTSGKIDPNNYLSKADTMIDDFMSSNTLSNSFYNNTFSLSNDGKVSWTFASSKQKSIENWSVSSGDKLVIIKELCSGLIKEVDAKKLVNKYKSAEITLCFINNTDLPGDDNGGSWSLFKKTGIVEGGPEDSYDMPEDKAIDFVEKQIDKAEKSGYIEGIAVAIIDGKSYLEKYYKDNINESLEYDVQSFTEGRGWDREVSTFQRLFNKDLNKLGDIKSPDKKITIKMGNHKFEMKSSLGYVGRQKLTNYNQVPTSVHLFNVNKREIVNDEIGIDRAIKHAIAFKGKKSSGTIDELIKKYKITGKNIFFKPNANIGLLFGSSIGEIGININEHLKIDDGNNEVAMESVIYEAVGDADDNKPTSDHPVKDIFTDIDRKLTKTQQTAKKRVQDATNAGRAMMKPVNRTKQWITKMVYDWKDNDETKVKERLADPHARRNLFTAITTAIKTGSLLKAGILLNPAFLFLSITKGIGKNKREFRIRNEMIGELKTEIEIIDEKIRDADRAHDQKAKYQLMRLKNEINKKLLRVGGDKNWKKIL